MDSYQTIMIMLTVLTLIINLMIVIIRLILIIIDKNKSIKK